MTPVIDFHAHALPNSWEKALPEAVQPGLDHLRRSARYWFKPVSRTLHRSQTFLRHFPGGALRAFDEVLGVAPLPGLLLESSPDDLREAMNTARVDQALLIAHPPAATNDWVLELAQDDPRFLPVVNIPKGTPKPTQALRDFVDHGARALKIHAAADGESPTSPRYKALLKAAADYGLPVILHTGCFHSHLLYRAPEMGRAELFEPMFRAHPELTFVLAHMNFHAPQTALDLAEAHENVWVDTSWQPAELIGEAARRIGAERVLFASDWPFLGDNLAVGLQRVRECVTVGTLTQAQADLILGANAARLLRLPPAAAGQ